MMSLANTLTASIMHLTTSHLSCLVNLLHFLVTFQLDDKLSLLIKPKVSTALILRALLKTVADDILFLFLVIFERKYGLHFM